MANERKRSAAAVQGGASSASKRRKTDTGPKFYAVRAGRTPGVYLTWVECQAQIDGFTGAAYKKFPSKQDAEAWAAGKTVKSPANGPPKFYAVAVGNPPGIYTEWDDAKEAIAGVKGPKQKKFGTRAEAVEFIKQNGNIDAIRALGNEAGDIGKALRESDDNTLPDKKARKEKLEVLEEDSGVADGVLRIWTDGSSRGNGKTGARAGFGVFFASGDPRNVSERLAGNIQTNQRGELMAAFRALELAPLDKDVQIITDSRYTINCATTWAPNWMKNGWRNSKGEAVMNVDIIKPILDLMAKREKAGARTLYKWVKGHAKDGGNEAADQLAVQGAGKPRPDM